MGTTPRSTPCAGSLFAGWLLTLVSGDYPNYQVLARSEIGTFSVFLDGAGLWNDDLRIWANIAAGAIEGTSFLFVAVAPRLYKFRVSDQSMLGSIEPAHADYWMNTDDLHLDSRGHLFVGTYSGVFVHDATSDNLDLLAACDDLDASRIALREDGDTVYVYYLRFRGEAVIGVASIDL